LYEHIARLAQGPWNKNGQLGLVVGATYARKRLSACGRLAPTVPLLIPGVGAQGGDAAATVRAGWRAKRTHHRQLIARHFVRQRWGRLCRRRPPRGAAHAQPAAGGHPFTLKIHQKQELVALRLY
jgi:hypothetical protein